MPPRKVTKKERVPEKVSYTVCAFFVAVLIIAFLATIIFHQRLENNRFINQVSQTTFNPYRLRVNVTVINEVMKIEKEYEVSVDDGCLVTHLLLRDSDIKDLQLTYSHETPIFHEDNKVVKLNTYSQVTLKLTYSDGTYSLANLQPCAHKQVAAATSGSTVPMAVDRIMCNSVLSLFSVRQDYENQRLVKAVLRLGSGMRGKNKEMLSLIQ